MYEFFVLIRNPLSWRQLIIRPDYRYEPGVQAVPQQRDDDDDGGGRTGGT